LRKLKYYTIILENGGIPLDVLEANVKRWIAEQAGVSQIKEMWRS
jgi:hypothetical protein